MYSIILTVTVFLMSLSGCGRPTGEDVATIEVTESTEETSEYYFFRELPESVYIEAAESFSGGSGTKEDPYLISTIEEMALLSNLMENEDIHNEYPHAYYELVADITLNEGDASQWRDIPPQYSWKNTALDHAENQNIGTEDAIIVLNGCSGEGVFEVLDEDARYENQIGGIIGNCSAEDEYTVNVINCTYSNTERGLGAKYLPDVGTFID